MYELSDTGFLAFSPDLGDVRVVFLVALAVVVGIVVWVAIEEKAPSARGAFVAAIIMALGLFFWNVEADGFDCGTVMISKSLPASSAPRRDSTIDILVRRNIELDCSRARRTVFFVASGIALAAWSVVAYCCRQEDRWRHESSGGVQAGA